VAADPSGRSGHRNLLVLLHRVPPLSKPYNKTTNGRRARGQL
jgi:hypothetical protein